MPRLARNPASGSENVYANGVRTLRMGDPVPSGSSGASYSPTVFANGKPVLRQSGSSAIASEDVYVDELIPEELTGVYSAGGPCVRDCMRNARKRRQAFVG